MQNLPWTVNTEAEIFVPIEKTIFKISFSRITLPRKLEDMGEKKQAVLMKISENY